MEMGSKLIPKSRKVIPQTSISWVHTFFWAYCSISPFEAFLRELVTEVVCDHKRVENAKTWSPFPEMGGAV